MNPGRRVRWAHCTGACLIALAVVLGSVCARAEAPMRTDDAGTLAKGGQKIEFTGAKDVAQRTGGLAYGLSPIENLELGLSRSSADNFADPALGGSQASALSAKWVPVQSETGWSFGLSLVRGLDRQGSPTSSRQTEHSTDLTGLASYRWDDGRAVHGNLGGSQTGLAGQTATTRRWSLGYELPVAAGMQVTLETFGQTRAKAAQAVGLRYRLAEGLKVSGLLGRDARGQFSQAGLAWEF